VGLITRLETGSQQRTIKADVMAGQFLQTRRGRSTPCDLEEVRRRRGLEPFFRTPVRVAERLFVVLFR